MRSQETGVRSQNKVMNYRIQMGTLDIFVIAEIAVDKQCQLHRDLISTENFSAELSGNYSFDLKVHRRDIEIIRTVGYF